MVCFRHVLGAVKFYSAIENVDGFSSRETQFYPQVVDIPIIDRASQAVSFFTPALILLGDTLG